MREYGEYMGKYGEYLKNKVNTRENMMNIWGETR